MSEYIKKEVAIELLKEIKTRVLDDLEMCVQVSIDVVTAIPAADVATVVRCDNCERCEEADEEIKQLYDADSDELYCRHLDCLVKPQGFCSAGKERER